MEGNTYGYGSPSSWIIDARIGAPPLQRIDSVIACIVMIAISISVCISIRISICLVSVPMEAVDNLFAVSGGL